MDDGVRRVVGRTGIRVVGGDGAGPNAQVTINENFRYDQTFIDHVSIRTLTSCQKLGIIITDRNYIFMSLGFMAPLSFISTHNSMIGLTLLHNEIIQISVETLTLYSNVSTVLGMFIFCFVLQNCGQRTTQAVISSIEIGRAHV